MKTTRNALVIFAVLLAGSGLLLFAMSVPWWWAWFHVRTWVRADARMISAEVVSVGGRKASNSAVRYSASYEYAWEGQSHYGNRVGVDPEIRGAFPEFEALLSRGRSVARYEGRLLERVSFEGLDVTAPVYVNPEKPEESMLFRDAGMFVPAFGAAGALLMIVPGAALVLARRRSRAESAPTGASCGPPADVQVERRGDGLRMIVPRPGDGAHLTIIEVSGPPDRVLHIRQESPSEHVEMKWAREEIAFIGVDASGAEAGFATCCLYVRDRDRKVNRFFTGRNDAESHWIKRELKHALGLDASGPRSA